MLATLNHLGWVTGDPRYVDMELGQGLADYHS